MELETVIPAIVNGSLAFVAIVLCGFMIRTSSRFYWEFGIAEKQGPLKWRIMRQLMLLILVAFIAAVFNLAWIWVKDLVV